VLKVYNISESSHHHPGAVLFDVLSCTSYVRFNWVGQQFQNEGAGGLVNVTLTVS
jgi:hypothetical protein